MPLPPFYETTHKIVAPLIKVIWRPRVEGIENIPRTGRFIVASNHLAFLDSFVIPVTAPRKVRFLVKSDYWKRKGLIGLLQRSFFVLVGSVPVDRGTLKSAQGSLDVMLKILEQEDGIGIYPEGTRSRDGRLYRGRSGAAWLAMASGAPVIPVGLHGTEKIMPKGAWLPRLVKVTVRFGSPVTFEDIDPSLPVSARRQLMTTRIMDAIAELSGQERADSLNKPLPSPTSEPEN